MTAAAAHIVITGGGTGGHLFPGIAIARAFQQRLAGAAILFVGTGRELEQRVVKEAGYRHAVLKVQGLKGMGLLRQFRSLVTLPGITNRLLARIARRIYTAFSESQSHFPAEKIMLAGNPVREEIIALGRENPPRGQDRPFTLLVAGGSQGARNVNTAVIDMIAHIDAPRALEVIHQSGPGDLERVRQAYAAAGIKACTEAFFSDMDRQYARADLVICRAGATTVAELTCSGLPAIFIPLPHAADNHQEINARAVVDAGAGEMIKEADLSGRVLWQHIQQLRDAPGRLEEMAAHARTLGRPEAADTIVADIVHQFLQPASPFGRPETGS